MRVTLLGTGCPVAHPRRHGPATLIEAGETAVLVDCGSGVTQRLVEAGRPGAALDALLVTHLHSDHLVDFYQLVISSWHQGRERPWRVIGPSPVKPVVEAQMAAWAEERALRVTWEARPSVTGLEVAFEEIAGDEGPIRLGGLEIMPVEVDHRPVEPAYGFVFRAGGLTAVVSGDTRPSPALIEAGRGCDLLVHEVFVHAAMPPIPGRRSAETVANVAAYHTGSDAVGGVAADMEARALALTHFVPPDVDRAALLAEIGQSYDGPIVAGEDGMVFDLVARSLRHGDAEARVL